MTITILYFSWIKEKVGVGEETVEVPPDVKTVAQLVDWLKSRSSLHAEAFEDLTLVRSAVDQTFVSFNTSLGPANEVAFFPPVTGG